MERYLKDEPKLNNYKKLDLDTPWDLFAAPSRILEFNCHHSDHNLDSLSMSSMSSACSGVSWESALSCALVVKKEKIDEDEDNNSDSCEEKMEHEFTDIPIQIKTENGFELRLLTRSDGSDHLPTLTPPSSPESIRTTTDAELALLGHHQGMFKVSAATNHLPRSAIVRVTTDENGTRFIQVSQGIPAPISVHRTLSSSSASPDHESISSGKLLILNGQKSIQ